MEQYGIYRDIAERAGGDVYIGVVGPVRTGKSTFIKRFMDLLVIPNMEDQYVKERARDELPQSAAGRAIMTAEPKFVPAEAAEVRLDETTAFRARLIDCVGYLVPGASGHMDGEAPRMVSTPWHTDKIPFAEAAETGTRKVIAEHSTVGIVLTTDGTVTDIPREDYVEAESRVVGELKALGKPFVIVLNTARPYTPETDALKKELAERYGAGVLAVNCAQIKPDDITAILECALYEFPVSEIRVRVPKWVETLPLDHWVKRALISGVKEAAKTADKLREVKLCADALTGREYIKKAYVEKMNLADGSADIDLALDDALFYQVLSETTGMEIGGEHQLISTITALSEAKKAYDKIKFALEEVRHRGYGVVTPSTDELKLEAPELVRHGSRYGVKIRASAPSLHIIQANIETEISPIVGTQKQSEDLIEYFNSEAAENPEKIWELNMFGKSMHDMVREGLTSKLHRMPEDAQVKMQDALQKIINEGTGGLICILL